MSAVGVSDATARLAELIRGARSVVALTGAGVSVPSGIPDFRSPGTGLWAHVDPMEVAHIDAFRRDPRRFWHFYGDRFQTLEHKLPNGAHAALSRLEQAGLIDGVITQNIDRLHAKAGTRTLIEVHGTITHSSCLSCGERYGIAHVRARQLQGITGIARCGAWLALKPAVGLFGELLPEAALLRAEQLAAGAELMLCVGTSLEVYPVAQLPMLTLAAGGWLAIVTESATPFDDRAAVRCDG